MPADRNVDPDARAYRYYRDAVEGHWDPHEVDLSEDRVRIASLDDAFDGLRRAVAVFGASAEAVTAPLGSLQAVAGGGDACYLSAQSYAAARHADFFYRYWDRVIAPEEHARGNDITAYADDRWRPEAYDELFGGTRRALDRLSTEESPENRAEAYAHTLAVDGILGQTGHDAVRTAFSGEFEGTPSLPGLCAGLSKARTDQRRHAGFATATLREMVQSGRVSAEAVESALDDPVTLARGVVTATVGEAGGGHVSAQELGERADERRREVVRLITDPDADLPALADLPADSGRPGSGDG